MQLFIQKQLVDLLVLEMLGTCSMHLSLPRFPAGYTYDIAKLLNSKSTVALKVQSSNAKGQRVVLF